MKICIINNLYPPYTRGGAEVVAQNQVNQLLSQGHDIFVITSKALFKKINKKNIYYFYPLNIFSFFNINKFPIPLRALWRLIDIFNIYSYFKIKKILKKEEPDLVYCHNLTGLGYLVPRAIECRYIQVMHDVALIRPSGLLLYNNKKNNIFIKIYYHLTRFLFNSPDEVHFPSQWLKKYYSSYNFFPHSKKQVIRNFNIKIEKLNLIKKNNINFLFVGQIEEHKGILFLIDVFKELSPCGGSPFTKQKNFKQKIGGSVGSCQLNIIGTGSKFKRAKKLADSNPNIIFHGYQPVNKFLSQADYTIVPSLCYENSPTIIFESLKAKVPVIAPNLGGIKELLISGINGYLYDPVDKNSLLNILKNTIINTDEKE